MTSSISLERLAALAGGRVIGDDSVTVDSCGLNSATVPEGGLFAALPGTRVHGARYAADTKAAAILTDEAGWELLSAEQEARPVLVVEDIREILGPVSAEIYGHPTRELTVLESRVRRARPPRATSSRLACCTPATRWVSLARRVPASTASRFRRP